MPTQTTAMTDYLEDRVLNHILRATASTAPTTIYAALFTANPGEAGGGTELTIGSLGYTRQSVAFNAPSSNTCANTSIITFGPNTTTNWGTIVAVALFDASSAGNMLFYCLGLTTAVVVGESVTISAGALTVLLQ